MVLRSDVYNEYGRSCHGSITTIEYFDDHLRTGYQPVTDAALNVESAIAQGKKLTCDPR